MESDVPLDVRSAAELDDGALAELFTAAYEGYLVPFSVDVPTLRFLTEAYDLDRDASRIAIRGGERVGLRGRGVGASHRRGGVGDRAPELTRAAPDR